MTYRTMERMVGLATGLWFILSAVAVGGFVGAVAYGLRAVWR